MSYDVAYATDFDVIVAVDTCRPGAPCETVWWDANAVTVAALAQLRLVSDDVDAGQVAARVAPAGQAINQFLDRPCEDPITMPPPPQLNDAIVQVVVELYRRKDAPPSSVDGMMLTAWRPPSLDVLAGVKYLISPFRRRWGIA